MLPRNLEAYLHTQIPLARGMEVRVRATDASSVILEAPLAPNINHHETAFGGSVSALAILSGWSLVHVLLQASAIAANVVIQRNSVDYERPISGPFTARSRLASPQLWTPFLTMLDRRGRARIAVMATIECNAQIAGSFTGEFVALRVEEPAHAQVVSTCSSAGSG
jgi:thioesterase domain-containing protein